MRTYSHTHAQLCAHMHAYANICTSELTACAFFNLHEQFKMHIAPSNVYFKIQTHGMLKPMIASCPSPNLSQQFKVHIAPPNVHFKIDLHLIGTSERDPRIKVDGVRIHMSVTLHRNA